MPRIANRSSGHFIGTSCADPRSLGRSLTEIGLKPTRNPTPRTSQSLAAHEQAEVTTRLDAALQPRRRRA
jgi:hypothetical protein